MPTLPRTVCSRCGARVSGRCARCRAGYDQRRGSPQARGYDAVWQLLSRQVLREEPTCRIVPCGRPSQHADHIIPVRQRPDLRLVRSNVQGLCASHHSAKTAREDGGFGNPRAARRGV